MSTDLLYHVCGFWGYEGVTADYEAGKVVVTVGFPKSALRCAACHSRRVIRRGSYPRRLRSVPIGSKPVQIALDVPRLECLDCGVVRQAPVRFADERRSYTLVFERYVLELCRLMSLQDVARHVLVSWDVVKDIQKRSLLTRYRKIKMGHLRHIAVDEICIGRGRRFLTIVLDLESGAIVFVGDGRDADALDPLWKQLKRARAKIAAVAMDMAPAYFSAVSAHLSKAVIVFDHFHIIKLFNEKLSDLRRDLHREATGKLHKKVLKGTRWLLLKNPENLDETRDERTRLKEALALNQPLATAYYMKEDLRQMWQQSHKNAARRVLEDWIRRAECCGIRILTKFAHTLALHRESILAYYDYPISTGPLEGTNNKIRTMQRQAYGYRDAEFFKLKLYALHESRYQLVG